MPLQDLVTTIITSVTASGILSAILIWLSREWISARLKTSIQHEYDEKLERYKAQLKAESEVALLQLRTTIEREAALHAAARASFAAGQKAAMERKLNAIDRLWYQILTLRHSLPPIFDMMTVDEYRKAKHRPELLALAGELSPERIAGLVGSKNDPIEKVRPYVGEWMWALFYCYQAIMIRRLFLFHLEGDDATKIEWYKDQGIRQLITVALTSDEIKTFDQTLFGKGARLQERMESKILATAKRVISGEEFGADSLEQAQLLYRRATELQAKSSKMVQQNR